MAKWTESDLFKKVEGKSGLTRFIGWFNNLLNPGHDWMDYNTAPEAGQGLISSVKNQVTQEHMTGADVEANEMSMQNAEDIYQRQVTGMQKAGLNPALMYQNGASGSTPQAQNSSQGVSMSELMQVMLLPLQKKMMEAQISNTDAKTQRELEEANLARARTENMNLVNKYYPQVTELGLEKTMSEIGVNIASIDEKEANAELTKVKKLIADKENDEAAAFFKARREYEEAKTEEARASAAEKAASALLTEYENEYARANGAKLSSSSILALVSALGSFVGLDDPATRESVQKVFKDTAEPFGIVKETARRVEKRASGALDRWRSRGRRFQNWVNKPKKAPWVK